MSEPSVNVIETADEMCASDVDFSLNYDMSSRREMFLSLILLFDQMQYDNHKQPMFLTHPLIHRPIILYNFL